MSKEQLAHFAIILGSLKNDLMADIERTVHTMQDEQTVFADPNDRASQETDMALELRNRDRERKLVKKIEQTIDRIKADDYGFCDKCGIEIGIQRLEARPTATLCIDCKTLEELREKQTAKYTPSGAPTKRPVLRLAFCFTTQAGGLHHPTRLP